MSVWQAVVDGADWFALRGRGYQFWSGIGSGSPFFAGAYILYRRHRCHVPRCWRLSWHVHPDHGHPVCRLHHPYGKTWPEKIAEAVTPE